MDPIQISHLQHIQHATQTNRLVLFIGAGVSANSGVPTWKELIRQMKEELPASLQDETDDLKVAQAYKDVRGEKEYLDKVKEVLRHNSVIPNPIHQAIFDINPVHVLTTNYDDLLEQELAAELKQYDIVRQDLDLPNMSNASTIVKMHGDFQVGNIVLTETDYFNYAKNFPLIRAFVQSIFANKLVVFIGFSFADLNLKMILNDIKNILGEKMQRPYLISLTKPDSLTINYFEKRFINIVWLPDGDVKALLKGHRESESMERNLSKLHPLGRKLFDYLRIIKTTDFNNASNPISYVWNKLKSYQDEMRVYGRGLRYFLPKNMGEFQWHEHSSGVQTFNKYFDEVAQLLKTSKGRYQLIKNIGRENVMPLLKLAYYNSLYSVDHAVLLNKKFFENINSYGLSSCVDYFEMFDFNGLSKHLIRLSSKSISGEIEDLETGYIYYKLGDYYRAYQEFNKVLPVAWKKGKFVLYFICLYNLYELRYAVKHTLLLSKTVDGNAVSEKLCRLNPAETLSKLKLPTEFRLIFQDLLANRYLNAHLVESEKLKEQIHSQRISAERGGSSMNSHIAALIGIRSREERFSNGNFILSDFNSSYSTLCRNAVIGILNSHATKDCLESSWFHNTKIEKLDARMLYILISSIGFDELVNIFKQYDIEALDLSANGVTYLNSCLTNLKDKSYETFWSDLVRNRIANLLFILSFTTIKIEDIENLYTLIEEMYYVPIMRHNMGKYIHRIIENYPPSSKIAKDFLSKILRADEIDRFSSKIIKALCEIMLESKEKLDILNLIFDKEINCDVLIHLGYIIPDNKKEEYHNWVIPFLKKDFLYYVLYLHLNFLVPTDKEEFRSLLKNYTDSFQMNLGSIGSILSEWRKDPRYSSIWEVIEECSSTKPYLQFALDPVHYSRPNDVHPEWIKALNKDIVRELIKLPTYNRILLKHIAFGRFSPKDRLNLLSIYEQEDNEKSSGDGILEDEPKD